jgi:hypothetical protein
MASTYSTSLKLELIGNGDQSGTWGTTTNTNLGTLLEQAITGVQAITMANADVTLTSSNGASDEARNAVLVVGGTNAAIRNVIAPAVEKLYVIRNNTVGGFAIVIKTSSSTGVTIPNGTTVFVYCDGTEFYLVNPSYASTNTVSTLVLRDSSGNFAAGTITANLTGNVTGNASTVTTNANLTGAVTSSGNATSLGSFTSANLAAALTDETGTGANVFANSPTLVTPALGTPSSGNLANCTFPTLNQNTTGTAAGLSSTLVVGSGGTGITSAGTAGNVLTSNGSAWVSSTPAAQGFPSGTRMSFNQTSAPTGWTKDTSSAINDSILRLVTGSVSSGGSVAFSTWNATIGTVGATTLSISQIPSHTHDVGGGPSFGSNGFSDGKGANTMYPTSATGGGGSHTHTGSSAPTIKYYDFIIASKD